MGEIGHRFGDIQKARDAPGGRCVDDNGVIDRQLVLVDTHHRFLDLAGEQHIAQTRCDRRRKLDRTDATHRPAREAEVVEHVEVFQERGLDVDRQCVDLAAALGGRDLEFLVGQRRDVEKLCNPLAPPQLPLRGLCGPRFARVRARAAATVDLPVPPLPVTKCKRAFDSRAGQPTALPPLDVVATIAC